MAFSSLLLLSNNTPFSHFSMGQNRGPQVLVFGFHSPGFHFGHAFLTHSHVICSKSVGAKGWLCASGLPSGSSGDLVSKVVFGGQGRGVWEDLPQVVYGLLAGTWGTHNVWLRVKTVL